MPSIHQDPALISYFQSHLKIQSLSFVRSISTWILTPQASLISPSLCLSLNHKIKLFFEVNRAKKIDADFRLYYSH
jgi:hypothetical protein